MNWSDQQARAAFVDSETAKALTAVAGVRSDVRHAIAASARHTDSPIEAQFAAWFDAARGHYLALGNVRFALRLHRQAWVELPTARYRLDFALEPLDPWLAGALVAEGLALRVGVELDGHDYHEKSRADVTKRNQRDRDLLTARWTILHFSGSELHRNPMNAVVEVLVAGADALDQAKAALRLG